MPLINGVEASIHIHEKISNSNFIYAKLIGFSNIEFNRVNQQAFAKAGIEDFLKKPIDH
jgi:hypothetical protein